MDINEALKKFKKISDNPNSTLDDLSELINQLSVVDEIAPKNAVTHLYTKVGENKEFITNSVRALDHTQAYEFLDKFDDDIIDFISNVIRRDNYNMSEKDINKMALDFLYGNFENKNNITKGLWGEVSEKFAHNTSGKLVCHIGDTNDAPYRVWWNVEMPKIMTDLNFTTINGIPKDDIVNVYQIIKTASNDSQALDCICKTICDIPANNNDANFWNDKIAVKYNISPDVDIDTFYHFSAYECLISTGADSSTIKKLGIMDNSDLLVKYKLLRDTNFEFVDTFKSIEYKISKGMIDPQNTKFKDVVPDSLKDIDNPIFDTMKEMRLDDALEFFKRNSFLLSESSSRTSWLTLQKAKLTNAIRNNPDLAQIISNGGELIFAALDLMDLVDICVDIYLGFRENTMTYEEAGELIHSWGYATLFSEIGAKTGDIVGKAIGTAVGRPLGPVAGSVIGGLAGGTLGYLLGALYGSIYYDEIYHGMFNIWDLILSDGNHILYGSININN